MTTHVEVQLLGGFAVRLGGREVTAADFARRTGAELVQLLALSANRRRHREQVVDLLWPDLRVSSAANALNKAASYARAALGDRRAIVVRDQVVHLFPDDDVRVLVDVDVVEAARADDPASIERARAAYRGDLLPASPYAEWVDEHRDRIRLRYVELLRRAGAWEELAELDPVDEAANVALMRRALAAGDRAGVVRRYDAFARRLREAVGLEPGSEARGLRELAASVPTTASRVSDDLGEDARVRDPSTDRAVPVSGPLDAVHGDVRDGERREPIDTTADEARTGRSGGRVRPRSVVPGREDAAASALDLLARRRLVTIVGPGGVGKTHLATALARDLRVDGATTTVVPLGRVEDTAGALQEVLAALDATRHADTDDLESITRAIGEDEVVLVLDNCEHVVTGARALVRAVLDGCPATRVLATSRVPLGLDDEHVVRLGPLERAAAIGVVVAEAARHGIVVDPDDALVDRVCRAVDDLPLALRLAAARTRSIDLEFLAATLERNVGVLGNDAVSSDDRTLRETLRWSFEALEPSRRRALAALSAFAGPFDLDGARAVLGDDLGAAELLRTMDDLVEASLVLVARHDGVVHYRLLEAIRWFARRDGPDEASRLRHLAHVRARVTRADALLSSDSGRALAIFEASWNDLRLAVATADELDQPEHGRAILAALTTYSSPCMRFDLLDWCARLLDADQPPGDAVHAEAFATWANMLVNRLELERAAALVDRIPAEHRQRPKVLLVRANLAFSGSSAEETEALMRQLLERPDLPAVVEAGTLAFRSGYLWSTGEDVGGMAERIALLALDGGPLLEAYAAFGAGVAAMSADPDVAVAHFDRAAALCERHDLPGIVGAVRALRAVAIASSGRVDDALGAFVDNLRWAARLGMWTFAMASVGSAALVLEGMGRGDLAVRLAGARRSSGFVDGPVDEVVRAMVDRVREQHPDRFDAWWGAGVGMDPRGATMVGIDTIDQVLSRARERDDVGVRTG